MFSLGNVLIKIVPSDFMIVGINKNRIHYAINSGKDISRSFERCQKRNSLVAAFEYI